MFPYNSCLRLFNQNQGNNPFIFIIILNIINLYYLNFLPSYYLNNFQCIIKWKYKYNFKKLCYLKIKETRDKPTNFLLKKINYKGIERILSLFVCLRRFYFYFNHKGNELKTTPSICFLSVEFL